MGQSVGSPEEAQTWVEHRICGDSKAHGEWRGSWRLGREASAYDVYRLALYVERVWVERRRVACDG
jgi:hypothetical protein